MKMFILNLLLLIIFQAKANMPTKEFKFEFNEFMLANAEYEKGPTGMTLFYFPKGAYAAIDIRGGAAAVRESSSIDELNTWGYVDAIALAGGSTYGLECASGVMAAIKATKPGAGFDDIPAVPAAIVYDYAGRENSIYPDKELGLAAFKKLKKNSITVGRAGAGANVSVGKYFGRKFAETSGQGAAFFELGNIKFFALTVLNAVGNIYDQEGQLIRGSLDPESKKRFDIAEALMDKRLAEIFKKKENTTISILITNADIDRIDLKRIAVMAHTAMAQSIRPFHTPWDGDTLFVVSTKSVKPSKDTSVADLGTISAKLMNDAIKDAITSSNGEN